MVLAAPRDRGGDWPAGVRSSSPKNSPARPDSDERESTPEQLNSILDALSERICRYSVVDHTIIYCNSAWAAARRIPPGQLIGRSLDELLTPVEKDALDAQLSLLGHGTPILRNSEPVPAPEMPNHWIRWVDHYLEGELGPEVLAVGRDATDEHLATQQLEMSEARFRELADRSADVVWRFSLVPVPHFAYMSPSVFNMTGFTASEVKADFTLFLDALDEKGLSMITAALNGERLPRRVDMTFRHADGSHVIGEVRITDIDNGVQGVLRDVTEIRALQAELANQALRDQLTGLANRRLFDEMLDSALHRTLRTDDRVATIYIDLDGFKAVNDNHGHTAGDRVLREVARRLQATVRDGDLVARVGGDEFLVLLELRPTDDENLVERIKTTIARPIGIGDENAVTISASVGIADTDSVGRDPTTLIEAADVNMYADKQRLAS